MPALPRLNRHEKSDRLVSAELLDRAKDRIADWWDRAYLRRGESITRRFQREAGASLPIIAPEGHEAGIEEVFDGLAAKRLMLKITQQLAEWNGPEE